MESMTFSDEEIQEELARLGYTNIPHHKLRDFQKDLNELVQAERSRATSQDCSFASGHAALTHHTEPPQGANAACVSPTQQGLRREDLELHQRLNAAQVPPHYGLFELPRRALSAPPCPDNNDNASETDSEVRRLKRKTLRKNREGARFIDESMSDFGADFMDDVYSRIRGTAVGDPGRYDARPRRSESAVAVRPSTVAVEQSADTEQPAVSKQEPPYRLDPDDARLPSVIYGGTQHPHTRNLRRADPVARYHQMQGVWAAHFPPGHEKHAALRWSIRDQMLVHELPEKRPQKTFVPNTYVPPPMRKRKALRWQIRMDMARM